MADSVWVRTYNGKSFYSGSGQIRSDNYFTREGYAGAGWNNGYGAYNAYIANNGNQTPLMVAYRAGQTPAITGADRLFAMELLNNGNDLRFGFGGYSRFVFEKAGNLDLKGTSLKIGGKVFVMDSGIQASIGHIDCDPLTITGDTIQLRTGTGNIFFINVKSLNFGDGYTITVDKERGCFMFSHAIASKNEVTALIQ